MSAQSYMLVYVFLSASYINSLKFENTLHLQNYVVLLQVWKGRVREYEDFIVMYVSG